MRRWLTSSASAGSSFSVGMKAWEYRMLGSILLGCGQHVFERVEPGLGTVEEPRGAERAAREHGAVMDPMCQREDFPFAAQHDFVRPGSGPAPDGMRLDAAGSPRGFHALEQLGEG